FHLDPERFVVTNSLTKAYGLSGIRCGWVLAAPELVEHMWHLHDIHSGTPVFPGEQLSAIAFEKLTQIAQEQKSRLDANRSLLRRFLDSRDDLDCFWPDHGTVVLPRLKKGSVDELCDLLRKDFEVTVVPGRFFECPDRFRIGVGGMTEDVKAALVALGRGL